MVLQVAGGILSLQNIFYVHYCKCINEKYLKKNYSSEYIILWPSFCVRLPRANTTQMPLPVCKHSGSLSSFVDFFFPLFPTGHGLLAVIIVYKRGAGTTYSTTAWVFMHLFPVCIRECRKGLMTLKWHASSQRMGLF